MPMIATTIISSIRVKPFCSCFIGTPFVLVEASPALYRTIHSHATTMPAYSCLFRVEKVTPLASTRTIGVMNCQFLSPRSGLVARDLALVHLVDLLLVEEHLGVAAVDLLAHEDVEEVRVDVVVELHAPEDLE